MVFKNVFINLQIKDFNKICIVKEKKLRRSSTANHSVYIIFYAVEY